MNTPRMRAWRGMDRTTSTRLAAAGEVGEQPAVRRDQQVGGPLDHSEGLLGHPCTHDTYRKVERLSLQEHETHRLVPFPADLPFRVLGVFSGCHRQDEPRGAERGLRLLSPLSFERDLTCGNVRHAVHVHLVRDGSQSSLLVRLAFVDTAHQRRKAAAAPLGCERAERGQ